MPSANRARDLASRACACFCRSSSWRCLSLRRPELRERQHLSFSPDVSLEHSEVPCLRTAPAQIGAFPGFLSRARQICSPRKSCSPDSLVQRIFASPLHRGNWRPNACSIDGPRQCKEKIRGRGTHVCACVTIALSRPRGSKDWCRCSCMYSLKSTPLADRSDSYSPWVLPA